MPEKRGFPLNNPPPEKSAATTTNTCPYCSWSGVGEASLSYHVNRYHEAVVAAEGERAREGGESKSVRIDRWLLTHGYVKCAWWPAPCATKINPLMARLCKHMNKCPGPG